MIAELTLADVGAGAILALTVLMILTGRLVPRAVLRDIQAERDTWREAHRLSEAAREEERRQVEELLEVGRTAEHVLRSLPRPDQPGEVTAHAPMEGPSG